MNHSIYVVRSETGPVKVGISANPISRFKQLQIASAVPLYLEFTAKVDGNACQLERRTHAILGEKRMASEWFAVTVQEAVAAINQASAELADIPPPAEPKAYKIRVKGRDADQRRRDRLKAKAAYKARKRREAGMTERAKSKARTKPWEAFGWCRTTWYYRGCPAPDQAG